jgi:hypothetical protein
VANTLDDRHSRLRVADQKKQGSRAALEELVAHGSRIDHTQIEFNNGACARREIVPKDPDP